MTTPNISEAARRAAEQEIDEFHYRHRITQPRHPFEAGHYVQAALDSAHPAPKDRLPVVDQTAEDDATKRYDVPSGIVRPAPKEGETPETDAAVACNEEESVYKRYQRLHCVARSLELRLAEARHELEQWKRTAAKDRDENVDLRNELAEKMREVEAARQEKNRWKRAFREECLASLCETESINAQLQKANALLADLVGWAETMKAAYEHPFLNDTPIEAARTHLNQQSK